MKRKLYLDIAIFIVILGGFGTFVFMQQQAPATETQTQEVVDAPAAGCCGAATVEGETSPETAGGCCGTSTSNTAQSIDTSQQVLPLGTPETDETASPTPQSEDADEGGCGCGG
jgi:hypothetical protein